MRRKRIKQGVEPDPEQGSRDAAFYFFCAFIVSYFTRITARVGFLGSIHFDLILAALTAAALAFGGDTAPGVLGKMDPVARQLWILLAYILITIPFVEWPGSVIHNLEGYAKSLCFFFFVVATVDTTRKLRILISVYAATQVFRVLEPLEMHLRSGYWGSFTSLGNWEYMDRLSGSPYDIINPNGLGFVIIMALPLVYLIVRPDTHGTARALRLASLAAMCYALVLSASRSGFLGLVFLAVLSIWRSKHRAAYLTAGIIVAVVAARPDDGPAARALRLHLLAQRQGWRHRGGAHHRRHRRLQGVIAAAAVRARTRDLPGGERELPRRGSALPQSLHRGGRGTRLRRTRAAADVDLELPQGLLDGAAAR